MRTALLARVLVVAVIAAIAAVSAGGGNASVGAVFTVTTGADSGPGSLRQAIMDANAAPGEDTIAFAIGSGRATIAIQSYLPTITDSVTIDGTTQPGFAGVPLVRLKNATDRDFFGLNVATSFSVVRGLVITGFQVGIFLGSGGGNTVAGNLIGVLRNGTPAPNNTGVYLDGDSYDDVIGGVTTADRNVISGNSGGVEVNGYGNAVQGNYIGTTKNGLAAAGNGFVGVVVHYQAKATTIGGAGGRNVISGNGVGVEITDSGATGNVVASNFIGTDKTGAVALPNAGAGVKILAGASSNTIGGTTKQARNIVSGNGSDGIVVSGAGTDGNVIEGNFVGADVTGKAPLGNAGSGILVDFGADNTYIRNIPNVVSANGEQGIEIGRTQPVSGTVVDHNLIGTDATGTAALGNGENGVLIATGSSVNEVASNLVSGNGSAGIRLTGGGTIQNSVYSNDIGMDAAGTAAIPNAVGIDLDNGADQNGISGNVVSGNAGDGIHLGFTTGTSVVGNSVGVAPGGPLGNGGNGISIGSHARPSTIGGSNTIEWNAGAGVLVDAADGIRITENSIFGNGGLGISLLDGGNDDQPAPTITSIDRGSSVSIEGTLSGSAPSKKFRIEVFRSPSCDDSGSGEGLTFVAATTMTTDATGNGTWKATVRSLPTGTQVTATATGTAADDTSQFSACFAS
jgi:parallel beta-helix repeat protein